MIVRDPTVPDRYSQALFNVAKRNGNLPALLAEVETLLPFFADGSNLRHFLEGPQISTENKAQVLERSFKGKIDPVLEQLMSLLLKKGRIEYVGPIMERFRILVEKDQGIYEADVATATPLADDQRETLQQALEKYTKAKLRIDWHVEPSLIGGVRFRYADTLVDDSVKGKLDRLRQQLQEAIR